MLIFANPLGASALDHCITLVHVADNLEQALPQLRYVGRIKRTAPQEGVREFHCYRLRQDVPENHINFDLLDPFPMPTRTAMTQPRGRFRVDLHLTD
jgi:hypothetical protein